MNGPDTIDVSGTVYWYGTKERVTGAVIKAAPIPEEGEAQSAGGATPKPEEGQVTSAVTDANGYFEFENLAPRTWTFVAFHEDGVSRTSEPGRLSQDKDDLELVVFQGTPDAEAGRRFFVALCVALGVLVIVYVALHLITYLGSPA